MYSPHAPTLSICSHISCDTTDAACSRLRLERPVLTYVYIYLFSFFISALSVSQDFDQDDYLGKEDLKQTLRAITANELTDEEMEFVSDKV